MIGALAGMVPMFRPFTLPQDHDSRTDLMAAAASSARPGSKRLGIGMHSYGLHWGAARNGRPNARFHDARTFLEYAHQLGAGGVQVSLGTLDRDASREFRAKAESLGLYVEGQSTLPQTAADRPRFETEVQTALAAGATVMRTALLGGRRYETFDSAQAFKQFAERSWNWLTLAEPLLRKHRLRLAVENHKDWLIPELLSILRRLGSEWVGVCFDFGNSMALLEDPMETAQALAPYAFSTHIKDMAVAPDADGFLLSEVPLGQGSVDLPGLIRVLVKANPAIQFNLEMITRDPLKIPCLTDRYWAVMPHVPGARLAHMLRYVRDNAWTRPLPSIRNLPSEEQLRSEDQNVRLSLEYARTHALLF